MMNMEELDAACCAAGIDSLLEELAEIADDVQTKTGWKRSFAPYILDLLSHHEQEVLDKVCDVLNKSRTVEEACGIGIREQTARDQFLVDLHILRNKTNMEDILKAGAKKFSKDFGEDMRKLSKE